MKKILFICLLISTILSAKSEAVLVELPTKDVLCPVYLSKIQASESYVSSDYIKRLEEILYLDFERSGKMTILKRTPELEKCLANSETPGATLSKLWKKQKAAYVIYSTVTHNKLSIFAFSTSGELIKQYKNLPLSGTLSKDRKLIHRLSDAIFEAFFHTKGIASTRLLYTIQFPKKLNGALEWTSEIWESDYDE
ncbi:MAG: hypothetical protein KAR79_05615, partial [Simkaniaceae bacterium]|nr:hypothetical protein [Simkaniaceae bacterium]